MKKLYNNDDIPIDIKTHRELCLKNLKEIKEIKIPNFPKKNNYETVLIEFRDLPHIEYLIRNTILKLPNWSHTIVCGNNNITLIKKICNNISKNINIIHLKLNINSQYEYNDLLLRIPFWNLFYGNKLLIYQEDTFLFHNKIDKFLKYDYIGAPWKLNKHNNKFRVGNGGFSLRTKNKMIECLKKINSFKMKHYRYLINKNKKRIPEDIFFAKCLSEYKLGFVPDINTAKEFSQEHLLSINPLGGHKYFKNFKILSIKY
jgi:hypothetical protein